MRVPQLPNNWYQLKTGNTESTTEIAAALASRTRQSFCNYRCFFIICVLKLISTLEDDMIITRPLDGTAILTRKFTADGMVNARVIFGTPKILKVHLVLNFPVFPIFPLRRC